MKVVILHDRVLPDAREDERDALVQAEAVSAGLRELGHSSENLPVTLNLADAARSLREQRADIVFNIVESVEGHGRLIHLPAAMLDALGIRYTGAPAEALMLTSHKLVAKQMLRGAGLPTPAWISPSPWSDATAPSGRYIVKSVWEHASVGMEDDAVREVRDPARLLAELREREGGPRGEIFAEQFIEGREFNVSMLAGANGPEVLPPAEMCFEDYPPDKPRIVGYRAKWVSDSFEYSHTVRSYERRPRDSALYAEIERLCRACWSLFGLRGYARVDFRIDDAGRPWILEINTNPCISPDAGFMAAVAQARLSFPTVLQRILADVPPEA
jgi:D-alanine-D-alanine ligase